jgi:guanylate kinase
MNSSGMLLVISGPSGVGKTTITRHVEHALDGIFSVSVTTRSPAADDVDGVDYCFIDVDVFKRRRDAGEFLEWAEVFGNLYGTPRGPIDEAIKAGKLYILEIDVQGAVQIKQKMPDAFAIFVLPPSEDELLNRLRLRQREDEAKIQQRFAKAKAEITRAHECGVYDFFITNDNLDKAVEQAVDIVRDQWDQRKGS